MKRWLVVALAAALALLPRIAHADPDVERAKRLFHQGNELRKAGDCEGALVLYLRSKDLVPSVPNLTNAAYCAYQLARWDDALTLYEELVVRFAGDLGEDERRSIAPTMADLRRKVGLLDVTANVAGTLVIDGRPRGKLPLLAPVRVLRGEHRVQILAEGFTTFDTTVGVQPGQTTRVEAELERLRHAGRLTITADRPDLSVFVDGIVLGKTPWEGTLAPGDHCVWLQSPTHGTAPTRARVLDGRTTELVLRAKPLGARVSIRVEPRTAVLSIGGTVVDGARFGGRLPLGSHRIEASETGYHSVAVSLDGATGGVHVLRLRLDAEHPRWSQPSGSFFVSPRIGGALALGTGSGAEQSCDRFDCDGGPAIGFIGAVHAGYELRSGLSFSLGIGYLALKRSLDRSFDESFAPAPGAPEIATSYRLEDRLTLAGPFAAITVIQRFALTEAWDISPSLAFGAVLFGARDEVTGTASGGGVTRDVTLQGSGEVRRSLDVFVAPGVAVSTEAGPVRLSIGVDIAFFLLAGAPHETGDLVVDGEPCTTPTIDCAPGERTIGGERTYGPFVALLPTVGLAYGF